MRRKSTKKESEKISTTAKGRVVEQIIASMHDLPGVKVQSPVKLPSLRNRGRKRDIDVLLTGNIIGYVVNLAFECKNESKRIGVGRIDEFLGKLKDVGIPPENGIYVSASGYTQPAIDRGRDAGIRLLILTGLTNDGIAASVLEALQSIVYLFLNVVNFAIRTGPQDSVLPFFLDEQGKVCGSLPDLIWRKWLDDEIPSIIGNHEIALEIPPNWRQVVDGRTVPVIAASAEIRVLGLAITIGGRAAQHLLVEASEKSVERVSVSASFDPVDGSYPVRIVQTEEELSQLAKEGESVKVTVGPIRLPRIRVGPLYWPPSERAARMAIDAFRAFEAGNGPDPHLFDLAEIEGTDMQAIWEPVWDQYLENVQRSSGD